MTNFVHQVVNPLNGVIGTLDNVIDGTIGNDRRIQRIKAARAQLENCVNLLRNLAFLVNRPEQLQPEEMETVVLPQVIIIDAAMFFQEEAGNRGVQIDLDDGQTQNSCSGHPDLIRQVLMNIFDNCTKYSKSETKVTVDQWIQKTTGHAMISIRNTPSTPISDEDMERVFEYGFRGENAKSTVASGTGLGMYICRQIIEDMHKGKIDIRRDKGGLLFQIRIPRGVQGDASHKGVRHGIDSRR